MDILKFLKYTNAQGVLVARGAIHNPTIFQSKDQIWKDFDNPEFTFDESLEQIWTENCDEQKQKEVV